MIENKTGHPLRTAEQRYQGIDAMSNNYSIQTLWHPVDVSRSGFYGWKKRKQERVDIQNSGDP